MTIHFTPRGDNVILDAESTAAFRVDPAITDEVNALAKRNVAETGRPCDVFADDGTTLLIRARPT